MNRVLVVLFAVVAVQLNVMASGSADADYVDARPITLAEMCP